MMLENCEWLRIGRSALFAALCGIFLAELLACAPTSSPKATWAAYAMADRAAAIPLATDKWGSAWVNTIPPGSRLAQDVNAHVTYERFFGDSA
jgi:hypothetical protein